MLKKMLNSPERITYARLREVCELHVAEVYAKVRLADVLPIEGSGLSQAFYEFALQAHYDFVVTGSSSVVCVGVRWSATCPFPARQRLNRMAVSCLTPAGSPGINF